MAFSFDSDTDDIYTVASLLKVSHYGYLAPFYLFMPRCLALLERTSGAFIRLSVTRSYPAQSRCWYGLAYSRIIRVF